MAVDAGGGPLAYTDTGIGAPAFVFIPGGGADRRAWAPQVEDLAGDYRCVAVDLRGTGGAPLRTPATVSQAVDDLARLIRGLDVGPAIVAGHSLGGLVALRLNKDYPELVLGVVAADTPLRSEGFDASAFATQLDDQASLAFLADRFSHAGTPAAVRDLIAAMAEGADVGAAQEFVRSATTSAEEMAALVKAADGKPFMTLWPVAEREQFPGPAAAQSGDPLWLRDIAMFVRQEPIAGAGHYLQLEHPRITSALLRAFVDDVLRDPRIDDLRKGMG